jgi:hypothetical protein
MAQVLATISNWPKWAQAAFSVTNTHPSAKGVPAMRGALAVAAHLSIANALPWAQAFTYGMQAYGIAVVAHAKAGGTLPTAKGFAGLTPSTVTVAQVVAAAAKTGFACTVQVANGMLGTIANNTAKGTAPLYFAPLASVTNAVTFAAKGAAVANAYNSVPAAQPPTGYAPTAPAKVAGLPTLA